MARNYFTVWLSLKNLEEAITVPTSSDKFRKVGLLGIIPFFLNSLKRKTVLPSILYFYRKGCIIEIPRL